MKSEKTRKTIVIVCTVLLTALLILLAAQINKMGVEATPFFDEMGLPTLLFDACAALFGVLLLIVGRNVREDNTSLRKLCKLIGIFEIAGAVICFLMTQLLLATI